MEWPNLYIKDSKGKTRVWSVKTEKDSIIVSHGVLGGKIQEKLTKAKGKNIGKSNETTPEEQAVLEAQSKWNKQKDREDYHEDVEQAGKQLRPMLALDYHKVPHRVKWEEAVSQPKLDGLRLVCGSRWIDDGEFEMLTRKGETYQVPHLREEVECFLELVRDLSREGVWALDGELYCHGMPLQTITSLARKNKPESEQLEFWIFDLVIPGMSLGERLSVLKRAFDSHQKSGDLQYLRMVETNHCNDVETLKEHHKQFLQQGCEGTMIRHLHSDYAVAQRSADLFKYKDHYTDEFKVIGAWEDKNGNIMFTCECDAGQFDVTPKRTHDERKEMLKSANDFIGQWLTVKYYDFTIDGIPKFGVGLDIRECDEDGNPLV